MNKSKLFSKCIKNLYTSGVYSVDYAILKLEEYHDKAKINDTDYEELLAYFVEEMEKQIITEVESVEESPIEDETEEISEEEKISE